MPVCNATLERLNVEEIPYFISGRWTLHQLLLILAGSSASVSILLSSFQIWSHARNYRRPAEQKCIIRILLMIIWYSVWNFQAAVYFKESVYLLAAAGSYAPIAFSSFFALMVTYLKYDLLVDQQRFFRERRPPKNWKWPVTMLQKCTGGQYRGPSRRPLSAVIWFNVIMLIIYTGIFQYPVVAIITNVIVGFTQPFDRYCAGSLNPQFAHIWVLVFAALSATVAQFFLEQFHHEIHHEVIINRTSIKLWCINLVLLFSQYQYLLLSILLHFYGDYITGPIQAYQDAKLGVPATILCIELAIISMVHLSAFRHSDYLSNDTEYGIKRDSEVVKQATDEQHKAMIEHDLNEQTKLLSESDKEHIRRTELLRNRIFGVDALLDCLNPWDLVKQVRQSLRSWSSRPYQKDESVATLLNHEENLANSAHQEASKSPASTSTYELEVLVPPPPTYVPRH